MGCVSPGLLFPRLLTAVDIFADRSTEFSDLFRRALSMTLDGSLSWTIRTHVLLFITHAFQSLDCTIVRKECAPLVSISIWHNLSTEEKRDAILDSNGHLRKAWRASAKRYDAADDATKARLRFERSWLYTAVMDFMALLYSGNARQGLSGGWDSIRPAANTCQSTCCTASASSSS